MKESIETKNIKALTLRWDKNGLSINKHKPDCICKNCFEGRQLLKCIRAIGKKK